MINNKKYYVIGVIFALAIGVLSMTVGINNAGYRTVVQYPNGKIWVKFEPGWYLAWFGTITEYSDVVTFDYDKLENEEPASIDQKGISVMFQAGGLGTIYGIDQFLLPSDEPTMLKVHKRFRSKNGIAYKLIKPLVEEGHNLTTGLLTSEEMYAEKRSEYVRLSEIQIGVGKIHTILKSKLLKGDDGKDEWKKVPVVVYNENGSIKTYPSELKQYGVTLIGHKITDRDFEPKTLKQISVKRAATMDIITSKANAEKAKQDTITTKEQGIANVMKAKYKQEVVKEEAVVIAERQKQVAIIDATRQVEVAAQQKLEAEQKKLAAVEYKQERILRGEGDGEYKRLVMEADGALQPKLDTYERVSKMYASALAQHRLVPDLVMGGSESNGNGATQLIDMLTAKTAKDLSLDMTMITSKVK